MPDAPKRLGARSRCWDGRTGFWFDESGEWTASDLRPHQDAINQAIANLKRAADRYSIRQPSRWVTGISPEAWLAATESYSWPQHAVIGIDQADFNERSKPMGLTKDHSYKDADGDDIQAQVVTDRRPKERGVTVLLATDGGGTFVEPASAIPLALNVLGYDRPGILGGFTTTVGNSVNHGVVINSTSHRDKTLAAAIAYLKSVDLYDQRVDERKAEEEVAAAKQAERNELLAERDKANEALHEAARRLNRLGIYGDSIDGLTKALARRDEAQAALTAHVDGI